MRWLIFHVFCSPTSPKFLDPVLPWPPSVVAYIACLLANHSPPPPRPPIFRNLYWWFYLLFVKACFLEFPNGYAYIWSFRTVMPIFGVSERLCLYLEFPNGYAYIWSFRTAIPTHVQTCKHAILIGSVST